MDLLIQLLIVAIPVIIAIVFARLFNIIHGIFMYLFAAYLLIFTCGLVSGIADRVGDMNVFNETIISFLHDNTLGRITAINADIMKWIQLGVWVVLFIIFQIIACKLRASRIRRSKYSKGIAIQRKY